LARKAVVAAFQSRFRRKDDVCARVVEDCHFVRVFQTFDIRERDKDVVRALRVLGVDRPLGSWCDLSRPPARYTG